MSQVKTRITELRSEIEGNRGSPSERVWREELINAALEQVQLENQLNYSNEHLKRLSNEQKISSDDHLGIIEEFFQIWQKASISEKKDLIKVLVRQVDSFVDNDRNDGEIHISYVADHCLKAQWAEKKAQDGQTRTFTGSHFVSL